MFIRIGNVCFFLGHMLHREHYLDINDIELNPDTDDLSQVLPAVSGRKYTKLIIGVKPEPFLKICFNSRDFCSW